MKKQLSKSWNGIVDELLKVRENKNESNLNITRHGTTTLIAAINVENGKLIHQHVGQTRDEKDFADFSQQIVAGLPEMDKIVLLSDQLKTHMSQHWSNGLHSKKNTVQKNWA